jgi:hypothetical protein
MRLINDKERKSATDPTSGKNNLNINAAFPGTEILLSHFSYGRIRILYAAARVTGSAAILGVMLTLPGGPVHYTVPGKALKEN